MDVHGTKLVRTLFTIATGVSQSMGCGFSAFVLSYLLHRTE